MIRVVCADDHQFVAEGLRFLLSSEGGIHIQKIVTDGNDVMAAMAEFTPDILILDMGLPGRHGLDLLREIKAHENGTRVVVLTGLQSIDLLQDAVNAGADAVLMKASDSTEIVKAIRTVHNGGSYLGRSVEAAFTKSPLNSGDRECAMVLTQREKQVLMMIADGLTSGEISINLSIAKPTVRKHRQNLMEKLKLHNTAEITAYVLKRGLDTP